MKEVYCVRKYISINYGEQVEIDLGKQYLVLRNPTDNTIIEDVFIQKEIVEKVNSGEIPCSYIEKRFRREKLVCDIVNDKEICAYIESIYCVRITTEYILVDNCSLHKLSKLLPAKDFIEYLNDRISFDMRSDTEKSRISRMTEVRL